MGKYLKGILGLFSGLVGTVVVPIGKVYGDAQPPRIQRKSAKRSPANTKGQVYVPQPVPQPN